MPHLQTHQQIRRIIYFMFVCFGFLIFLTSVFTSEETEQTKPKQNKEGNKHQAVRFYVHEVLPLLEKKCSGCHGDSDKDREAELNLSTRAGMLKGGESGETALVPGHPEKSPLYMSLDWKHEDLQMPPKERNRLTVEEIKLVNSF